MIKQTRTGIAHGEVPFPTAGRFMQAEAAPAHLVDTNGRTMAVVNAILAQYQVAIDVRGAFRLGDQAVIRVSAIVSGVQHGGAPHDQVAGIVKSPHTI